MPFKPYDYGMQTTGFTTDVPNSEGTSIDSMSIVEVDSRMLLNIRYKDVNNVKTMQVLDLYSAEAFRTLVLAGALDVETIASKTLSSGWTKAQWEAFLNGNHVDAEWPIKPEDDLSGLVNLIKSELSSVSTDVAADKAKYGSGQSSDAQTVGSTTATAISGVYQAHEDKWNRKSEELPDLITVLPETRQDDIDDGVTYGPVQERLAAKKSEFDDVRLKIVNIENDYKNTADKLQKAVLKGMPFVKITSAVQEAMWNVDDDALTLPSSVLDALVFNENSVDAQAEVLSKISSTDPVLGNLATYASQYLQSPSSSTLSTLRDAAKVNSIWTRENISELLTVPSFSSLVRTYGAAASDKLLEKVSVLANTSDSNTLTSIGDFSDLRRKFTEIRNWLKVNVLNTTVRITDIRKLSSEPDPDDSAKSVLGSATTTSTELMNAIIDADDTFVSTFNTHYGPQAAQGKQAYGSASTLRTDLDSEVRAILQDGERSKKRYEQYTQIKKVLADLMDETADDVVGALAAVDPVTLLTDAQTTAKDTIKYWRFPFPAGADFLAGVDLDISGTNYDIYYDDTAKTIREKWVDLKNENKNRKLTIKTIRVLLAKLSDKELGGNEENVVLTKRDDSVTGTANTAQLYLLAQIYLLAAHDFICLEGLSEFYTNASTPFGGIPTSVPGDPTYAPENVKVVAQMFSLFGRYSKWATGTASTDSDFALLTPSEIQASVTRFNGSEQSKKGFYDGKVVHGRFTSLLDRDDVTSLETTEVVQKIAVANLTALYTERVLDVRRQLVGVLGVGVGAHIFQLDATKETMDLGTNTGSLDSLTIDQLRAFVYSDRLGSDKLGASGDATLRNLTQGVGQSETVNGVSQALFIKGLYVPTALKFNSVFDSGIFASSGEPSRGFSVIEKAQLSVRFSKVLSSMLTEMTADLDDIVTFLKTKETLVQCINDLLAGNDATTAITGWGGYDLWTNQDNTEVIELGGVTDLSYLFSTSSSHNISSVWETSSSNEAVRRGIRNAVFKWNVSGVKNMSYMFAGSKIDNAKPSDEAHEGYRVTGPSSGKYTRDFAHWADKLGNLETCQGMFKDCSTFVGRGIASWTSMLKLTNLAQMFMNCSVFNQSVEQFRWKRGSYQETNISGEVTLKEMFRGCSSFNKPVGGWIMTNVTSLEGTFRDCKEFNQPLIRWTRGLATTAATAGAADWIKLGGSAILKNYSIQYARYYHSQTAPTDRKTLPLALHTEDMSIYSGDTTGLSTPQSFPLTATYRKSDLLEMSLGGFRPVVVSGNSPLAGEYPLADHFSDLRRVKTMAYMCSGCEKFSGEFTKAITREFIASYYYCSEWGAYVSYPDVRLYPTADTQGLINPKRYHQLPVYLTQYIRGMFFEHDTHYLESLETMECAFMNCTVMGKSGTPGGYWGFSRLALPKCRIYRSMFKGCTNLSVSEVGYWFNYNSPHLFTQPTRESFRDYGPRALNSSGSQWTWPGSNDPHNGKLFFDNWDAGWPANHWSPMYGRGTRWSNRISIPSDRWEAGGNLTGRGNNTVSREWVMLDGWEIIQSQSGTVDYTSMFESCRQLADVQSNWGSSPSTDYIDRFFDQITSADAPAPILRLMFAGCWYFNGNVTSWKIRNPQAKWGEMMFFNCHYFNRDLTGWQSETNAATRTLYRGYAAPPGSSVASTYDGLKLLPFVKRLIYDDAYSGSINSWRRQGAPIGLATWKANMETSTLDINRDFLSLFNNTFQKSTSYKKYFRHSDIENMFHGCYRLVGETGSITIPEWFIVISNTVQGVTGGTLSGTKGLMRRGGKADMGGWPASGSGMQALFLKTADSKDGFSNPVDWTDPEAYWGLMESRILTQLASLFCGHSWENAWDFMNPDDVHADFKDSSGKVNSTLLRQSTNGAIGQLFRTGTQVVSTNGAVTYHSPTINGQTATPKDGHGATFLSFKGLSGFACFLEPRHSAQKMTCLFEESVIEGIFSTQTQTGHTEFIAPPPGFGFGGLFPPPSLPPPPSYTSPPVWVPAVYVPGVGLISPGYWQPGSVGF